MHKRLAAKISACAGVILVWLPILVPVVITIIFLLQSGLFRFDFLMPAEMAVFFLIGGILLLGALRLSGGENRLIPAGFWTAAGAFLLLSILMPIVSHFGGASAKRAWAPAAIVLIVVYTIAVVLECAGGVQLVYRLFRPEPAGTAEAVGKK
jgi:hypothetical protein